MLVRRPPQDLLPGVKFARVDYADPQSFQKPLAGQDAVVSALPRAMVTAQLSLIDVAIAAGVRRFIPSEFGANLQNERARRLVNYRSKVQVEEYLEQKASSGLISYTFIYTNALLDWSIRAGIILDFRRKTISLYNGGDNAVSMTTTATSGCAVAGVLLRPSETKNRAIYVHDTVLSQKELLAYAKEITGSQTAWQEEVVDLVKLAEAGTKENSNKVELTAANANMTLFHAGAMSGGFAQGFGNRYSEADNGLLGIQRLSEDALKALLRELYEECQDV